MEKNIKNRYNEHSTILADIALAILNGNKSALDISGTKEIIALYLMIPYMSKQTLDSPDEYSFIPRLTGEFWNGISIYNLRDTISHSFVTVEEDDGKPNSRHGKCLYFDDRILFNRKKHQEKGCHGEVYYIPIKYVHERLVQLAGEMTNAHKR